MRTILITGPGGGGRTTVAAATALRAAREGSRTLLLSAERADTPGAVLGTPTGARPVEIEPRLTAWRPDAAAGFRRDLAEFQQRAAGVLDLLGASRLDAEEVTALRRRAARLVRLPYLPHPTSPYQYPWPLI